MMTVMILATAAHGRRTPDLVAPLHAARVSTGDEDANN